MFEQARHSGGSDVDEGRTLPRLVLRIPGKVSARAGLIKRMNQGEHGRVAGAAEVGESKGVGLKLSIGKVKL